MTTPRTAVPAVRQSRRIKMIRAGGVSDIRNSCAIRYFSGGGDPCKLRDLLFALQRGRPAHQTDRLLRGPDRSAFVVWVICIRDSGRFVMRQLERCKICTRSVSPPPGTRASFQPFSIVVGQKACTDKIET